MNKKTPTLLMLLALAAFLIPATSVAETECKNFRVAAAKIPHFIENANSGVFIDLIRTAAQRAGLDINVFVYPKKRALKFFQTGQVDALLPHSSSGVKLPSYSSIPILIKRDFAFVRRGSPIPKTIKELEGLEVGLTNQYAYPVTLTSNENIHFSRGPLSDEANIRMLSFKRFDASIIEERSGLKAISKTAVTNIVYDKDHPMIEQLVWVLYGLNNCGKIHKGKIDAAFASMKADGSWQVIMNVGQ